MPSSSAYNVVPVYNILFSWVSFILSLTLREQRSRPSLTIINLHCFILCERTASNTKLSHFLPFENKRSLFTHDDWPLYLGCCSSEHEVSSSERENWNSKSQHWRLEVYFSYFLFIFFAPNIFAADFAGGFCLLCLRICMDLTLSWHVWAMPCPYIVAPLEKNHTSR